MSDEASATAAQPMEVDSNTAPAKTDDGAAAPAAPQDESGEPAKEEEQPTRAAEEPAEKPDVDMKDASDAGDATESAAKDNEAKPESTDSAPPAAGGDAVAATATPKNKAPARRKSTAGESAKGKKLNKKASKAAILHTDAKPGEHYFIKLKGFPQWPCIICDEDMLPHALLKSRPVSAARPDGQYREDFADGGKRAADRTFPIMYLATNEFGWVSNKDLIDLDPEKVMEQVNAKMRKDLILAHQLAEEHHDLAYYKGVLNQFQEELLEKQKAAEAKAAAASTPKASKKKAKAAAAADEDVDMEDIDDEPSAKKEKKRKNPEDADTPQRSDSVKKPKIKLTHNTPKSNGAGAKAAKGASEAKSSKKAKKATEDSEERLQTPKEPEMSAEDRFERKKKEVLFLRHKLQKGLLTRDQQPKEEEMKMMSDYLTKLEGFPDLETEIIRVTKINKVLKAMLKLDNIPKESDFEFKPRSQVLLDKWNKLLATEDGGAPAASEEANGVNGHKTEKPSAKEEAKSAVNGVEKADTEEPEAPKKEVKSEDTKGDVKGAEDTKAGTPAPDADKEPKKEAVTGEEKPKVEEDTKAPEAVDAAA